MIVHFDYFGPPGRQFYFYFFSFPLQVIVEHSNL